jgi:predicted  nucleic acid-binding Zn-ribbon protein
MEMKEKLLNMKQEIAEAKTQKARFEGELDSINTQLKAVGINSIEEAESVIEKLNQEITELSDTLEDQVASLTSSFEWKTIPD